jgi:hypothetical protein
MLNSVMGKVCAYLNYVHIRNSTSRDDGKETELMLWIGLLIIVGLLVIAAFVGADIDLPDLF